MHKVHKAYWLMLMMLPAAVMVAGLAARETDEKVERLERRLWAVLRIMAKKGLISREEFLQEFHD